MAMPFLTVVAVSGGLLQPECPPDLSAYSSPPRRISVPSLAPRLPPGAADLAELKVRDGAGIDEGLSDDREAGVDMVRLVNVEDKLGVFQDVYPEPERKAVGWGSRRRCEPTPRVRQPGPEDRLAVPFKVGVAPSQDGTSRVLGLLTHK